MIFVRTAGESDIAGLYAILATTRGHTFNAASPAEGLRPEPAVPAAVAKRLRERMREPATEFVVADDGGTIVGMAFATFDGDTRVVRLRQLFLRPERQEEVIADALLSEIEASFPDAERVRVDLDENPRAAAFYEARGFDLTGEVPFGDGGVTRVFERPIHWAS